VNLAWAVAAVRGAVLAGPHDQRVQSAYAAAEALAQAEAAACRAIGDHGLELIREVGQRLGPERPVQILTHCNAGWLATMEYGTALASVYRAHEEGIPAHVWVAETRPRNQGWLTAWELGAAGVPHTVVADNASGHLLQRGEVDLVFVGTDRTTRGGDVCNKVGTYLRALAARDAGVPFYVAAPSSSIDWTIKDGMAIPIEERSADEMTHVRGLGPDGRTATVQVAPPDTAVRNFAFDVTPARLVTGLITERGICAASEAGLLGLFPERQA
jgi:methylthioribose-1-phosphate isomerase